MKFEGLLDPVDRIAEILFGLIMAVTIVGSLSIATAGSEDVKKVTAAAIGCNLAWGLVDAVMYVMRIVVARRRMRWLARGIAAASPADAARMLAQALPPQFAAIAGPDELEGMRKNVLLLRGESIRILTARDLAESVGVFVVVVLATFPVVIPFLVLDNVHLAMSAAQAITVAMLFIAGFALANYSGHDRRLRTGLAFAVLGVALIAAVKALGG
jgi:VIT1/CCC1 family predicted Fe2+/Mn2+ transporter